MTSRQDKIAYTQQLLKISRDPGSVLHQARRKKRISIPDIAKRLRTTSETVRRIEQWQLEGLMGPTFLDALLSRYAAEVGIDIRTLLKGRSRPQQLRREEASAQPRLSGLRRLLPKRTIYAEQLLRDSVLYVVSAVAVGYVGWVIAFASGSPTLGEVSTRTTSAGEVTVSGRAEDAEQLFIHGWQVPVGDDGRFSHRFTPFQEGVIVVELVGQRGAQERYVVGYDGDVFVLR